jgi:biotin carboxylase
LQLKKILLLGGSFAQIPAINAAKNVGLFTILCDYLIDNPGQYVADTYIVASITDKDLILHIATENQVDYIWAYASDPAALTAAFVSEKLGLPGNSVESIKVLSDKQLFRERIRSLNLNCPNVLSLSRNEIDQIQSIPLTYPLIVKPVDSSGSKGVLLINTFADFEQAAKYALTFSKKSRVIIEEVVDADLGDIHGDGFVLDGELIFASLGDHIYDNSVNPFNPIGTLWPSTIPEDLIEEIKYQVKTIITASGFQNGPINIEARVNHKREVHIMEIGPRSGGHFVPQCIHYGTDFDMVNATLSLMLEEKIVIPNIKNNHVAYYALHSGIQGVLRKVEFAQELLPYIKEMHMYKKTGDMVQPFQGANAAVGILIMVFESRNEMDFIVKNITNYIGLDIQ